MTCPGDTIPSHAITVSDALEALFHVKFPAWRRRLAEPGCFKDPATWLEFDRDEQAITSLLYEWYRSGTIPFYFRAEGGEILRLTAGEGKNSWTKHAFANHLLPSNLCVDNTMNRSPVFLMKTDLERLTRRLGAHDRSRGGRPHRYDPEKARAYLKREYRDGPTLQRTCTQAQAALKLMSHMCDGDPDHEPSKSWAELVVSRFVAEEHPASN